MANTKVTSNVISDDINLGGNPTTTTQSAGNNTTRIATTAFVKAAIDATIDSAPGALDTLNELAAAIGDDANFSTTITNSIAAKLPLAGGTLTGALTGTTASFETSSTTDHVLRLTDTGAINYDFKFPDTATIQLETHASNDKMLKLSNTAGGDFNLTVGGAVMIGGTLHDEWHSDYIGLEIGHSGFVYNRTSGNELFATSNAYYDSGWKFSQSGRAAMLDLQSGRVRLRTSNATGSQDGAITWVNAIDIAADTGNITTAGDINLSSHGIKLNQDFGSGVPTITTLGTAANGRAGAIHFTEQGDVSTAAIYSTDGAGGNANYGGLLLAAYQSDIRFSIGGLASTKMLIDTSGRVLIGLTSNFAHTEGDNLQIGTGSGDTGMTFYTGQDGRSSIFFGNQGTNGNVDGAIRYFHETYATASVRRGIGIITGNTTRGFLSNQYGQMIWGDTAATTPSYPGSVTAHRTGNASSTTQSTWSFNATANGSNKDYGYKASGTGAYAYGVISADESTWMSRLGFDGRIYLTNTTVGSISDRRLKKDIVDASSQWDDIKALKFKNYKWKDETRGTDTYLGLIADEVKKVSPNLVEVEYATEETMPEDGKDPEYEGVKYSIVWMKSVIALQEAMAKIEELEAKVKALEEG